MAVTRRTALASFAALASPLVIPQRAASQAPADWRLARETDWLEFAAKFEQLGAKGTLVLLDGLRGGKLVANAGRASEPLPPGLTFTIPTTLIALHLGDVKDIDEEMFKWSGQRVLADGKPLHAPACDADIPLRVAFANGCVPVYDELARRIGAHAYSDWLTKFDYGEPLPESARVENFRDDDNLRISADQQTKFLRRLITKTLPVTPRASALTEEAMFIERIDKTAIHGASDDRLAVPPAKGWWVGFAQRGEDVVLVALHLDRPNNDRAGLRYDLAKEALRAIQML